ncbi:hypothetical protein O3886_07380 [Haemophilus sputorum]|uniref:hypothetical protein n=1 Tax=Haemophilus sputorum TaxID=1078480 RepID=UPI002103ADB7|nr:hypothetical protein [Haemophilus sputorum]MCQ1857744.1 hypothetical protein [Haemophilus sputorum]
MPFQTFGKFIFPAVTTIFSLDVLSSAYHDMSSYDISYSETGDLLEESFPHNIKNSCDSEIKKISVRDILHSHEYIDYFVDGAIDLDRSDYFKKSLCYQDDSLNRKEAEARSYFEKNRTKIEADYREHLEDAKKYLFKENAYKIKNSRIYFQLEYNHEEYEKTGTVNLKLEPTVSSFRIENVDNIPFENIQFYIKPSEKQLELLSESKNVGSNIYTRIDLNLESLKKLGTAGCNYSSHTESTFGGLGGRTTTSSSACIATKLDSATIKLIKFDGYYNSEGEKQQYSSPIDPYDDKGNRWELLEEIPIKWKTK